MDDAVFADEGEDLGRHARRPVREARVGAGVGQRGQPPGHRAVDVQVPLLQAEPVVGPVEVAFAVAADPLAQDQVLRPGRAADRVVLHELEARDDVRERARGAEGRVHRRRAEAPEPAGLAHGAIIRC